ncbi:hypothetical protein QVM88_17370 [Providencia stuartii]|uniref:hypothetical protein n=1 Tax=Providencia stuartii TaxID=588 RepID=UPI0025AA86FB|nr:hypothetical protein [Providencia stuartii]MDN0008057.1 hypothetical protein [Providencia stuartii]
MKLISQNLTVADFFKNGGVLEYEVEANEIDESNPDFYKLPTIQPKLSTGFELPPSEIINYPKEAAQIVVYGDDWTRFITRVYAAGGRIIYKQISPDIYHAECTLKR